MGISIWQLLIVLVIVMLLFGTKKLRGIGTDLGSAVRGFKSSMKDGGDDADAEPAKIEKAGTEEPADAQPASKQADKA